MFIASRNHVYHLGMHVTFAFMLRARQIEHAPNAQSSSRRAVCPVGVDLAQIAATHEDGNGRTCVRVAQHDPRMVGIARHGNGLAHHFARHLHGLFVVIRIGASQIGNGRIVEKRVVGGLPIINRIIRIVNGLRRLAIVVFALCGIGVGSSGIDARLDTSFLSAVAVESELDTDPAELPSPSAANATPAGTNATAAARTAARAVRDSLFTLTCTDPPPRANGRDDGNQQCDERYVFETACPHINDIEHLQRVGHARLDNAARMPMFDTMDTDSNIEGAAA